MMGTIESLLSISPATAADILDAGILLAFAASIAFVVGYSVLAPWWEHKVGWSVVLLDITLTLVLTPGVIHLLFNVPTTGIFFVWYRCLSLFAVAAVTLWRLALVKIAQDEMRREIVAVLPPEDPAEDSPDDVEESR